MNQVYKALSDPTRRKILQLLRKADMTAGDIGEHFDISAPALSRHFSILKNAGLISSEKKANYVEYQLNLSLLEEAMASLMDLFELESKNEQAR